MPLTITPLPYGIRFVSIKALPSPYTTPGTLVQLPYSRTLSWTDTEDFADLRGDDSLIASHGAGPQCNWDIESGGIQLEAAKLIMGGATVDTGTTPNQVKTYTKLIGDQRPYFKAEGQSISDSGGDLHAVLYRAKATGDTTGDFADGAFFLFKTSGKCFGSLEAANINRLYDFVQRETAATPA
jgi:hypothetical protein